MNLAELYEKMMDEVRLSRANASKSLKDGDMSTEEYEAFTGGLMVAVDSLAELMKHAQEKEQRG